MSTATPVQITVHVEQYGHWWKLTPDEWRACLKTGIDGQGHELPSDRRLVRRSPHVAATDYNDGQAKTSYYARRDGILIYSPLDWIEEDYQGALNDLNDLTGSTAPAQAQEGGAA